MVLRLSDDELIGLRPLEATGFVELLQPADVGATGGLFDPVFGQRQSCPRGAVQDQAPAVRNRWVRSRRLGFATQTEMDAVEDLQSP